PPITNITISKNYMIMKNGSFYELFIPYTITTASYLSGTILQNASLYLNNSYIASNRSMIPLGKTYGSEMMFEMNDTQYLNINTMILKDTISMFGTVFSYMVRL
ncbi:MAG: hypothetical protein QXF41_03265, partial [Candidatus Micrarchaeaceae archaeon]